MKKKLYEGHNGKSFMHLHKLLLEDGGCYNGLCCELIKGRSLEYNHIFKLLMPVPGESIEIAYWGNGSPLEFRNSEENINYGGLRQNIIILCALLNGEKL